MRRTALTPELVGKIGDLFSRQGWPTTSEDPTTPFGSRFERFCYLMERLSRDEQDFVLNLSADFKHLGFAAYERTFVQACTSIRPEHVGSGDTLVFIPLKNPRDREAAKSGDLMVQIAKTKSHSIAAFAHKKCHALVDPTALGREPFDNRTAATIVFVDDYIGSGETAVAAIDDYNTHLRRPDDKLLVISLVSLRTGHEAVIAKGVPIFSAEVRRKGITESDRLVDKEASLLMMKSIEERIGVPWIYKLGYNKSEGLESLLRTPDNTFPLFWITNPTNESPWPAPFPENR